MKKLNLLLSISAISLAVLFTSCKDDEPSPVPTITFDSGETLVLELGEDSAVLTGTIKAEGELKSIAISKAVGSSESSVATITDFSEGAFTSEDNINCSFRYGMGNITQNTTVTFTVTDKEDQFTSQSIDIEVTVNTLQDEISNVKIYCTLGDGSGESTCASVDGSTYAPASATAAEQALVDFVYFYQTSAGIYAPDAIPAALNTAFTSWTVTNTTYLTETSLDFTTATYAEVEAAISSVSTTQIVGLEVGDVIAFETEGGKIGIFKVDEIEPGYNASDYIVIDIKVEE